MVPGYASLRRFGRKERTGVDISSATSRWNQREKSEIEIIRKP